MLNARPRGGSDPRWYSPDRDVAVVLPELLTRVFRQLRERLDTDPQLDSMCTRYGVTDADLVAVAKLYSKIIVAVRQRGDLREAFNNSSFSATPAQAIVGQLVVKELTKLFCEKYHETLMGAPFDYNSETINKCISELEEWGRDPAPEGQK